MFVTYQTVRSAMNGRQQQKLNDIEEQSSLVSPSSGKAILGNLDHRRSVAVVLGVPSNNDDDALLNTSMNSLSNDNTRSSIPQTMPLQPAGRSLPLTNKHSVPPEPKLLHPLLLNISLHIRFGINGLLSNVIFMFIYNWCVVLFEKSIPVTTIYAGVYLLYIPLNHFLVSILVFGWPDHYCGSLMNNFPIGLTAIALGSLLTAYLDRLDFSKLVDDYIYENLTFSKMPPRVSEDAVKSEFWSSLAVLFVTSIWTYVLSIFVNQAPTKSDKKEL